MRPTPMIAGVARRRRGLSLVEVQISFVVLGIVLAGLAPVVVMQYRQHRRLQSRFPTGSTFYLAPSDCRWASKLGVRARLHTQVPMAPAATPTALNSQQIEAFSYNPGDDTATAVVNTDPIQP